MKAAAGALRAPAAAGDAGVSAASVWEEEVVIPTYPVGAPDRNPLFLEKRVYQGSSGAVYPFPVIDTLSDEKTDRRYRAVFLENEYLKIMVLPELGGRVQMAYAKKLDYHFVYYNRVIKPALVGLAGPWISGGIEFNWPQHHRPTTFMPVDSLIEKGPGGRATVWLGEIDRMQRTKSLAGLTLYPGRSYLEISVRLWNRTPFPQTFLWWANPAVHVNDSYQSVFPPDVRAVFDHGRREVSRFPIATGTYYKVDYSAGVDISWYRNILVPTSYMAYHSEYDFVGGYDHGRKAGLLHVADHRVSPGKKLWTWGRGEFGRAWERNLTDEDGPYIELMTGVFTDNQPDFTWLAPGETKSFTQYFFPYAGIGMVKQASRDAALALEVADGHARIGVCTTSPRRCRVSVSVRGAQKDALDHSALIEPERPYVAEAPLPRGTPPEAVTLTVVSDDGEVRLSYRPGEVEPRPVPEPARAPLPPSKIRSADELFLIGLHLEQYRHATFRPEDYYGEALARDPGDVRCNLALGLLWLRRGDFAAGEDHLRRAVQRATSHNPNPADGSPHLFLGLALELQEKDAEAADAYAKAAWGGSVRAAACAALARLAMKRGDFTAALRSADESLESGPQNPAVRTLRAIALRKLGLVEQALAEVRAVLREDPFNYTALNELGLTQAADRSAHPADRSAHPVDRSAHPVDRSARPADTRTQPHVGDETHARLETAAEYIACGLYEEAAGTLEEAAEDQLACWLLAFCRERRGDRQSALRWIRRAESLPPRRMFVNQLEAIPALELAGRLYPEGAGSWYHLGNLFYANKLTARAVEAWEKAEAADGSFPTVRRNLALAAFNRLNDPGRARAELEKAFSLDPTDARVLLELDQLHRRLGADPRERLRRLEDNAAVVARRDDLSVERVSLLNLLGEHERALEILMGRRFHPWEGGEGKVTREYVAALLGLAKSRLRAGRPAEAAELARRALTLPPNLAEGRLSGAVESDIWYWLGCALEAEGEEEAARSALEKASVGDNDPAISFFYNDQPADMIFFQGLALARLGLPDRARSRFHRLVDYGDRHVGDRIGIDYFAVSLPDMLLFEDDLSRRNAVFCRYITGLGAIGLGERDRGRALLEEVLAEDPSHAGACAMRRDLDQGWRP